jgi:N,N'-diacetyllegionaminate synthase
VFKIGHKIIKKNGEPFIVAEAGINHNGELGKAFAMIEAAKGCGADAVKFQTFKAEEFISNAKQTYTYRSQGKKVTESMLQMFQRYEFTRAEWFAIKKKCDKTGIIFMSTPQNRSDLDLLLEIGLPAIKVGSDDFNNLPQLRDFAKTKLPMIISCGMSDLVEVKQALEAVGALRGSPTVLMLCTSQYPTPPADVNIRRLTTLIRKFPMIVPGYSDHTRGVLAASLAVALGAVVFEKHFTLDHDLPGPDHWFSAEPKELKAWVEAIRAAHIMIGSPLVKPTKDETSMKLLARRSIVAINGIRRGEIFTESNIGLRRPGTGLPANKYENILGRKAKKDIRQGAYVKKGDY